MVKQALSLSDTSTSRISPFLRAAMAVTVPQEQSPQVRQSSMDLETMGIQVTGWLWDVMALAYHNPLPYFILCSGLL